MRSNKHIGIQPHYFDNSLWYTLYFLNRIGKFGYNIFVNFKYGNIQVKISATNLYV